MKKIMVLFVGFIAAIVFNVWLDSGCHLQGVITTHGKVCIN